MAVNTPDRRGGVTQDSLPLGRVLGVRVGLNWSMLIIFWLVSWSLADTLFPDAAPGRSAAAYWSAALVATLLFYTSLLVHELAHAVVARRYGVEVEGITLWLFGGVARLHGEAHDARAELRIAVVGPATSLAIGAVSALVAMGLEQVSAPTLVIAVPVWLAAVNGMLALFNLLPAFPLDGGRVLRALLWRRRDNRVSATRSAARAGTWFGWALMALGLVELFATTTLGGLWLVFLGWFLVGAARGEAAQSMLHDAFDGVRVAEAMSPDPVLVPDWIVLQEFLDHYALQHRFTSFPVRDFDGRVDGLVTLAQVKIAAAEHRQAMRVRDVMWKLDEVPITRRDEPLLDLLARMGRYPATRALVFDGEHLAGIVSPTDVSRMLQLAALRIPRAAA
jgi:Zn-dependent protease/CBS domain-containing protein